MLNYYDRIDSYKRRNYFQINQPYLDIYGPEVANWVYKLDVVSDILKYASSVGLKTEYDILDIRVTGPMIDRVVKDRLLETINTANQILAEELGCSNLWKEMKGIDAPNRHFLTVTVSAPKIEKINLTPFEEIENTDDQNSQTPELEPSSNRRTRAVRTVSSDKGPI